MLHMYKWYIKTKHKRKKKKPHINFQIMVTLGEERRVRHWIEAHMAFCFQMGSQVFITQSTPVSYILSDKF